MPEKHYTVEGVVKRTTIGPAGRLETVYEVSYITDLGVRDTAEFPTKDYTPENVEAALNIMAKKHEAIMKLGSQG